jgi:pimeloyl-ACP methyl ester carboxylesterase
VSFWNLKHKPTRNGLILLGMPEKLDRSPSMIIMALVCFLCAFAFCRAHAQAGSEAPLLIAKEGYVFAGGKYNDSIAGKPMSGQLYAEFQVPAKLMHPFPIVMISGGGQTGSNFTQTPDGREGWAQFFLRRGYAVYVADQVGRGRSPYWSDIYGRATPAHLEFVEQRFAAPERYNLWPQAHFHTQWPGSGMRGDPVFDVFYATQVPMIADFTEQQELNRDALIALLEKIGPAILLTHSQAGAYNWPVADARPALVKAILAVEPQGPPGHNVDFIGAPNYFKELTEGPTAEGRSPKAKMFGLGDVPLNYSPPVTADSPLSLVQEDRSERPDFVRCWRQKEPARKLINLRNTPILIVTSEASFYATYDHCTAAYLEQAGVHNTHLRLEELGIHGNGHMMMLEKNNKVVAGVLADWLDKVLQTEGMADARTH